MPGLKRLGPVVAARLMVGSVLILYAGDFGMTVQAQTVTTPQIVAGVYLGQGVECAQLLLPDGEQISLEGMSTSEATKGQTLHLTGQFQRVSRCLQGRSFRIESLRIEATTD